MNHLTRTIAAALVICTTSFANAQTQESIDVPASQTALTNVLSKYNGLFNAAPNDIQRRHIASGFGKEFCAEIPRGAVSGWIGTVTRIDDYPNPDKGINLELEVSTDSLQGGAFGNELSLGNSQEDPHIRIRVSSPLYNTVSTLKTGDTVVFGGTFVPFSSAQACYGSLSPSIHLFSFHFSSIHKMGSNLALKNAGTPSLNSFLDRCVDKMGASPEYAWAMAHPEAKLSGDPLAYAETGLLQVLVWSGSPGDLGQRVVFSGTPVGQVPIGESADQKAEDIFQTEAVILAGTYRELHAQMLNNGSSEAEATASAVSQVKGYARNWCAHVAQPQYYPQQ